MKKVLLVFKTYLTKFENIYRYLIYLILDLIISKFSQMIITKTLLLIRLDSIGDYILVRNYFQVLKQSIKYKDYKITLCGNIIWRELAESLDGNIFEDFVWINRKKFNNNIFYKYKILKDIYQKGFEIVIDTTFSRENLFGDSIVNSSKALHRIGSKGSPDSYVKWKRNLLTDKYYSELITQSSQNLFEFYRNKEFFEAVLNEKIELAKPIINVDKIEFDLPTPKDFIVIFSGAQEEKRKWSYDKFISISQTILSETNFDIVVAGSSNDKLIADRITLTLNSNRVFDMTGKTSLPQLAKLISKCKVLISNETSAVHFAASVAAPFVCISNGNHLGRFNPYPAEMEIKCKYVYPADIEKLGINALIESEKFRFDSDLDINSITPASVYFAFEQLL